MQRRFSYGFARLEDLAGVAIVAIVLLSAIITAYEFIDRFYHPQPLHHLGALAISAIVGFVGNEIVAVFRIRVPFHSAVFDVGKTYLQLRYRTYFRRFRPPVVRVAPADEAPEFMVMAMRDPHSANLDRIQVVKGWTKHGLTYEKIYDVAWSGDRQPDAETGKVPAIVDIEDAVDVNVKAGTVTFDSELGSDELSAVWTDPDFDPTVRAFYYLRALEVPSPRYTAYDYVTRTACPRRGRCFDSCGSEFDAPE